VRVAYSRNKLALRTRLRILNLKSQVSIFYSFLDIRVHIYDFLKFVAALWSLKWAWQIFFCQSIGIDENNAFQLKCLFNHKNCRSHSFATNLSCIRSTGIRMPNPNSLALIVSEISTNSRTDGFTHKNDQVINVKVIKKTVIHRLFTVVN